MAAAAPPQSLPRRLARIGIGLLIGFGVIGGSHWYVARRFFLDPGWGDPIGVLGPGLVALGFSSFFALPLVERRLPLPWMRWLSLPIVIWMGVLWFSFSAWVIADAVGWSMGAAGGAEVGARGRALFVGAVVLLAVVQGVRGALRIPRVRRVEIEIARWPKQLDGFRIAQISDIHIGPVLDRRFAAGLTARVNGLDADLVAVTGDLVDGDVERLHDDVEPFGELRGKHGVFFITGNHDVYSGDVAWVERVRELGMQPLRNARVRIGGEEGFDLAGVDDHRGDWRTSSSEDLEAALEGRDSTRALVLLAHDPATFKRASLRDVDLQISGHTHGGQMWPFHGLVRLSTPWVQGLHRVGDSQIWVSRGSGFWGPPMRLFAPAEVSEIVIRSPR
jgi:hypothetical protein